MKDKKERYYDELIKKRIGEAIREFSEEDEKLDPEIFREWVKEAKRRKIQMILSRLVDTFFSRISLTMPPAPKSHNTACVLPQEEPLHWQSRSSGYSSS